MNNREMDQDFIVIGAGIIGLATAEQLLLQGATVTLLERGEVGLESSWAGGGILSPLCPWDYPNEVTRLTNYSASLFANWMDELHTVSGIDPEYERSGMLVLPPLACAMRNSGAHRTGLRWRGLPSMMLFLFLEREGDRQRM